MRCKSCEHVAEAYRPLAMFPATPPCPDCGGETEQIHLPKSAAWSPEPVIIYKAPDGTFRFPGDGNGSSAKSYEKQGYERMEIRGAVEMRRFEGKMNKAERARAERHFEARQQQHEERQKFTRGQLREQMQRMSELGKDVARAAMAKNDGKPVKRINDCGFHSEVYAYDRSNREDSRDSRGMRRRD